MTFLPFPRQRRVLCLFLGLLAITACTKDELTIRDPKLEVSPEFGVPLAHATITTRQVIRNFDPHGEIIEEENEVLSLVYRDTLTTLRASDYLSIPNQSFSESYTLTPMDISMLGSYGEVAIEGEEFISLDFDVDQLDSIRFSSGTLRLVINADGDLPIHGVLAIVHPQSGNELISLDVVDGEAPVYLDAIVDLTDKLFHFGTNGVGSNLMKMTYSLVISDGGNLTPSEIQFDGWLESLVVASAGGYIAPRDVYLDPFSARVSMFDSGFVGQVRLEDPRINVYFDNGFGLSVRPVPDEIVGTNRFDETMTIHGSAIQPFPVIAASPVPGQAAYTELAITNESMTPSVTDFMAFEPHLIEGDFHLEINPDNQPSSFVTANDGLDIRFEVEVPLYGSIANFKLTDTTTVNVKDVVETAEDFSELEELVFRLAVRNGLPLDASVQLVFLDADFQPLDSLFSGTTNVIPAAPVNLSGTVGMDDYGRVNGVTSQTLDVHMTRDRALNLDAATHIVVRVAGHTTTNGSHPIRVYPEDHISVSLAAKAKLNLD